MPSRFELSHIDRAHQRYQAREANLARYRPTPEPIPPVPDYVRIFDDLTQYAITGNWEITTTTTASTASTTTNTLDSLAYFGTYYRGNAARAKPVSQSLDTESPHLLSNGRGWARLEAIARSLKD